MWFPPSQSDVLESIRNPEAVGVSMVPRDHWPKNLRGGFESEGWRFLEISGHDRISFIEVYWWWWWWWWFFFFEFLESFDWTSFGHWTTFMEKKDFRNPTSESNLALKDPISGKSWKDGLWPWVYHRNGVILFCEGVECGVYCSGWTHRGWVKLGRSNDVATHVVEFLAVENKIFGHSQTHCWMIQKLELISILWVFCFLTRQLEISSWHCEMNGDGK